MKNRDEHPDLYTLSLPIPRKYIKPAPAGKFGSFVPHYVVTQMLLATVGPFDWELVQILKGDSSGTVKGKTVSVSDVIVGAVYRLTCYVDGSRVIIEEVGELDAYTKSGDGARLKHASSDALKRCAMRLGVAIQLWCKTGEEHLLPRVLKDEAERLVDVDAVVEIGGEELDDESPYPKIRTRVADAGYQPEDTLVDLAPQVIAEAQHQKYKPMVETVQTTNEDDWNLLHATLATLPTVKDTIPMWTAYATQMYDLMVRTGCWTPGKHGTSPSTELGLKGLSKEDLVAKITAAWITAKKKAAQNAPF